MVEKLNDIRFAVSPQHDNNGKNSDITSLSSVRARPFAMHAFTQKSICERWGNEEDTRAHHTSEKTRVRRKLHYYMLMILKLRRISRMKLEIAVCIFIKSSFFLLSSARRSRESLSLLGHQTSLTGKNSLCVYRLAKMWISRARGQKKCEHTATTYHRKIRPQTCAIRSRMPYCLFFKILIHIWCFQQNTQLMIRVELIEDFNCVRDI